MSMHPDKMTVGIALSLFSYIEAKQREEPYNADSLRRLREVTSNDRMEMGANVYAAIRLKVNSGHQEFSRAQWSTLQDLFDNHWWAMMKIKTCPQEGRNLALTAYRALLGAAWDAPVLELLEKHLWRPIRAQNLLSNRFYPNVNVPEDNGSWWPTCNDGDSRHPAKAGSHSSSGARWFCNAGNYSLPAPSEDSTFQPSAQVGSTMKDTAAHPSGKSRMRGRVGAAWCGKVLKAVSADGSELVSDFLSTASTVMDIF